MAERVEQWRIRLAGHAALGAVHSQPELVLLHRFSRAASLRDGLRLAAGQVKRSEEHTSELQSHSDLVCRLLLEKKNKKNILQNTTPSTIVLCLITTKTKEAQ